MKYFFLYCDSKKYSFNILLSLGVLLYFTLTGLCQADTNQFNPAGYFKKKPISDDLDTKGSPEQGQNQTSSLKEAEVTVNGIKYYMFKSGHDAIYLPKLHDLSADDLDRALCYNESPESIPFSEASLAKFEHDLSSNLKIYADLIHNTIKKKCGPADQHGSVTISPENGLEIGVEGKKGQGDNMKTYKIYNKDLKPNIGIKTDL